MDVPASPERWSLRQALQPGIEALRHQWLPFLLIQIFAASVVFSYYRVPELQSALARLAEIKTQGGIGFAFAAGFVAGGFVPEVAKLLTGRLKRIDLLWARDTLFTGVVIGTMAITVFLFYILQSRLFGDGTDFRTLAIKTLFDQGVYSTVFSIPYSVTLFAWRRNGYSWRRLRGEFNGTFLRDQIVPALLPCWAFWVPFLFCVYALPPDLQFPMSICGTAAWSILLVFMTSQEPGKTGTNPA